MPSNTLLGPGNTPANTKAQLLHIGTGTLGTGAVVRLGDGTATPLTISTTGLTVAGTLTADAIIASGISLRPSVWLRLTAPILATDTVLVPLTPLSFAPESGATYEIEMLLIITSLALTGGPQVVNTGGAGSLYLSDPQTALGITVTGGSYLLTASPIAGTWVLMLKGVFIATSTAPLTFSLRSDDTNDVTALTGSHLRYTKIS